MRNILIQGSERYKLTLSEKALDAFCIYAEFLEEKNKVMNLTAITDLKDVAERHFIDCLSLLTIENFENKSVIDIGSGAGFPGIPLKLAVPSIHLTLLDSLRKRVDFLEELSLKLNLEQVKCMHARAEEAALLPEMRDSFDFAVSRAVAKLNVLCEICLPFVKISGAFIAMKGTDSDLEVKEAQKAITVLGGTIEKTVDYEIPNTGVFHRAVIIRKTASTPKGYPRRFSRIQKSPL